MCRCGGGGGGGDYLTCYGKSHPKKTGPVILREEMTVIYQFKSI